jgi:Ca2+-binding RTX toxin-like protein
MALNTDGDVDVTWTPNPGVFPIELQGRDGDDFINGRGQGGAGLAYLGPLVITGGLGNDELVGSHSSDEIYGGEGNDIIFSHQLNDYVEGGPGDDAITSGEGNDQIVGGPGADNLNAGFGDDFLNADDAETDTQIHGGPDTDTAWYDGGGVDPAPIAVENATADPGQEPPPPPPPPPAGACEYRAATQAVVASMPTSGTATLSVVGGEIRFGAAPAACGAATTTNTDSVEILGVTGAAEHLTLDQSAGLLAPGATGESNTPEIELSLKLGDTTDELVVVGTAANDTFAAGASGVSLNSDGDVDVTFDVLAGEIDFSGAGGVNFLTGRGGFGAGLAYNGVLTLIGGDLGDELNGGNGNDVIVGGAGNDVVNGNAGSDQLSGGGGNDSIAGGDGNDSIVGGGGVDTLNGGFDNDVLEADDDEADAQIHGGPGTDTAYVDAGVDPATIAVETVIPR